MSIDRLSLLQDRLGAGWSFEVGWLASNKLWFVRIWNPATESRYTRIEKADADVDEACRQALASVKAFKAGGWAAAADALKEALEETQQD